MTEPATPALRERRRNQTLREIGDAALRLFDSQGYKQTTIEDVARAAGVSSRTVFRYYATKADLIFDWFPDLEDFIKALSLEATTPSASLRELERIVQGALDGFETMDAATAEQYSVFRRMVSRDPDLSAALSDWEQRLVKLAHERVRERFGGQAAGAQGDADLAIGLVLQTVISTVALALDLWTKAPDASLSALYAQARQTRDAILAG